MAFPAHQMNFIITFPHLSSNGNTVLTDFPEPHLLNMWH